MFIYTQKKNVWEVSNMVVFGIMNAVAGGLCAFSSIVCVKTKQWFGFIATTTLGAANICLAIQHLIGG